MNINEQEWYLKVTENLKRIDVSRNLDLIETFQQMSIPDIFC
jgi:hypothetical protein